MRMAAASRLASENQGQSRHACPTPESLFMYHEMAAAMVPAESLPSGLQLAS
jgi:hypothetical protein